MVRESNGVCARDHEHNEYAKPLRNRLDPSRRLKRHPLPAKKRGEDFIAGATRWVARIQEGRFTESPLRGSFRDSVRNVVRLAVRGVLHLGLFARSLGRRGEEHHRRANVMLLRLESPQLQFRYLAIVFRVRGAKGLSPCQLSGRCVCLRGAPR